jgi:uncharacterized coiled-coil protein SlyX
MFNFIRFIISPIFLKILPYLAVIITVLSGTFYIYHHGYDTGFTKAKKQCDTANLEAQIIAQDNQIKNLEGQLVDTQTALETATGKKIYIIKRIAKDRQVIIHEVSTNPTCTLSIDIVQLLNNARSTTPSNHK